MADVFSEKNQQRDQLLLLIYELSQGSTLPLIEWKELEKGLGWDSQLLLDTYRYIRSEGYLGEGGMGSACISHEGIKRVEAMLSGRQPESALANVMIMSGGHVGNLSLGNNNIVHQGNTLSPVDLAENLRKLLSKDEELTGEAHHLINLVASESTDRMAVVQAVHAVCEQKPAWKQTLRDFALQSGSSATGTLLAEAVKFVQSLF